MAKNPSINLTNPTSFKDCLFVYIGSSRWLVPTSETNDTGSVYDCKHDGDDVEFLELANHARIEQPPNDADDIPHYDTYDDEYSGLILNHDYFEKTESCKRKFIYHHYENLALVNQTLHDVIR